MSDGFIIGVLLVIVSLQECRESKRYEQIKQLKQECKITGKAE